ncbi:hypothetical protein IQ238_08800 [Pleurocapsales cyanobacterium LEGE 06147]|nr:hypothetical protein [Pleurocapsales cyanobacterium LEGE 06147]
METRQLNAEQSLQLKSLSEQLHNVNPEQLEKLLLKMIEIAHTIEKNTSKNLRQFN